LLKPADEGAGAAKPKTLADIVAEHDSGKRVADGEDASP
jgi:hypothetical protein